ncbi:N-acetylmuramoyl-L-alanine amidase [Vagococcus xieshaowenii]|uniref:N-acetylmuramoyl-L-alanine amidase n=3 Tax=Vagococcus xieshaowenii TaxID=2562451 RepID=A0A4Z0D827_9ENTE|nr:N-acetylmuramoyl-L-alanine amidase [Vagococcus xieshaowenii]TFZ41030.1 N-acetylmuramoyl-L-alanine amidase [Vagococcus xieshaowenii]
MMLGLVMLLVVSTGIVVVKNIIENNSPGVETVDKEAFIDKIATIAQHNYAQYRVLPSIVIGQAILESDWGRSELASYNNLFGVKASEQEDKVLLPTQEFVHNEWQNVEAYFKVYPTIEEAIIDHNRLFNEGVSWDNQLYYGVLAADNYKEAANALQQAGYATDPDYANKIINVIEVYDLSKYDNDF